MEYSEEMRAEDAHYQKMAAERAEAWRAYARRENTIVSAWLFALAATVASLFVFPQFWFAVLAFIWLMLRIIAIVLLGYLGACYAIAAWRGAK